MQTKTLPALGNINARPLTRAENTCTRVEAENREILDALQGRVYLDGKYAVVCGMKEKRPSVRVLPNGSPSINVSKKVLKSLAKTKGAVNLFSK